MQPQLRPSNRAPGTTQAVAKTWGRTGPLLSNQDRGVEVLFDEAVEVLRERSEHVRRHGNSPDAGAGFRLFHQQLARHGRSPCHTDPEGTAEEIDILAAQPEELTRRSWHEAASKAAMRRSVTLGSFPSWISP